MIHWHIFTFLAILALTGLFCIPRLDAEIYKWIDENGVIHYGNSFPKNTENIKIIAREYQYDEATDQQRVKADQKAIDALTEKNTKEEMQAKAAEKVKSAEDTKADADCYLKAIVDVKLLSVQF